MTVSTVIGAPVVTRPAGLSWGTSAVGAGAIVSDAGSFRGRGYIAGTTKIKGAPDFPAGAKLMLVHERSARVVGTATSNRTTGAYRFDGYDHGEVFTVLAYDLAGTFRAAVANGIRPVLP